MTERREAHDDLDKLLRQGVHDLVESPPSSEGSWSKLNKRIERDRTTPPPDPSAPADSCIVMEHTNALHREA